ncbi:Coiled-coil domain-containing protein 94 like protein [Daldinia childiae]|uniref:Coiled-coil domain-containing protein 94 like protein n=1 Tax=Daldinia childiae TaxID=326645 RepID=UPI0014476B26|nr:Coiled-coil domain-containing protein 94 like protein [Daldinia childiae]KAF3068898.1 Coiled-coil domain-containing protein 94 like protein [Daldinia childiae]
MSERKVLTKYYPPDFDPSQIKRVKGPKNAGPKVQTVRLAAPLACESGAKRSTEPWRVGVDETDEERLDRLEKEEEERNAMVELEAKTVDAKREMAVADALDEIRTRNARLERANQDGVEVGVELPVDNEAERQEKEDAEAARRAFEFARQVDRMTEDVIDEEMDDVASDSTSALTPGSSGNGNGSSAPQAQPATASSSSANAPSKDMPPPSFKRVVKRKRDHAAALGIKKKAPLV